MIKLVIYDMDDTLYDCSGKVTKLAIENVAKVLSKEIEIPEKEIVEEIEDIYELHGPKARAFDIFLENHEIKNKEISDKAIQAYDYDFVPEIEPFLDAIKVLSALRKKGIKLVLLTFGKEKRQRNKIEKLGIEKYFDKVLITNYPEKDKPLIEILNEFKVKPNETLVLGDKIFSEIKIANKLGITTVQYKHGRFKDVLPEDKYEYPDYKVNKHSQLLSIVETINSASYHNPSVVVIGGGTGLPKVLKALKQYTKNITGIVTVTDSGRSSGMLRKDMGIVAVGDLRNCLLALSDSKLVSDLFQYRFSNGSLEGHSFGNLFLAALSEVSNGFENAIEQASEILNIKGKVIPSTYESANVYAELENGEILKTEVDIVTRKNIEIPIKKVWLEPEVKASEKAIKAIEEADLIVLGPGSWYTSVISNLLVSGIPEAIKRSGAKKLVITNIMSQSNQMHKAKMSDYLKVLTSYLKDGKIDYVIYNTGVPPKDLLLSYEKENSFMIENDLGQAWLYAHKLIGLDIVEKIDKKKEHWKKQDWLRHDSEKLAQAILSFI